MLAWKQDILCHPVNESFHQVIGFTMGLYPEKIWLFLPKHIATEEKVCTVTHINKLISLMTWWSLIITFICHTCHPGMCYLEIPYIVWVFVHLHIVLVSNEHVVDVGINAAHTYFKCRYRAHSKVGYCASFLVCCLNLTSETLCRWHYY